MKPLPGRKHQRYVQTKVVRNGKRMTVYLHRRVWELAHGPIPPGFSIHHKDHNRANNRLENLMLISTREHNAHHSREGGEATSRKYRELRQAI